MTPGDTTGAFQRRATYRVQLRAEFDFAAAAAQAAYLAELGISHVYFSPYTQAAAGSAHGYDVVDPTRISEDLGGERGHRAMTDELRAHGYRDDVVEAILGHGDHTGVPRTSLLARAVYACDEMTGFVIAVTYVRPNRSLDEVDVRSVVKKMKDKGFARQVPRDQLEKGAVELGVPFDEHVLNVVEGLKTIRGELGL